MSMKKRWIALYVENEVGVLAKVSGLFAGKSYNLHSLTVGTTEDETMSRMTIGVKSDDITFEQIKKYTYFVNEIEKRFCYEIPVKHVSNSAGIIDLKEANMDLVRAGIILYGLYPSNEVLKEKVILKPALSLYSTVVFLKEVKEKIK